MYYQQGYRPPNQQPQKQRRPKKRVNKALVGVLVGLVCTAVIALSVILGLRVSREQQAYQALKSQVDAVQDVFLPNIYVDGIHLGGKTAQEGIDAVVSQINAREGGWKLNLTYQNHTFITLTYGTLGVKTDIAQVYALLQDLYQKGKTGTYQERKDEMDRLLAQPYYANTAQSDMTDVHLDSILSQIKAQVDQAPMDAYVAYFYPDLKDPFIIQDAINGASLDVAALKEQILEMAAEGKGGSLEIKPQVIFPSVTTEDARKQVSLLCRATTPISSTSTEERTSNIRTAFSRINGTILEPGKKFSFNNVTLNRKLENGYKYAIEYESGFERMGIGGGVCQASTTVYLAALQSGLEIVNRSSHSDRVSYTTFGQDATVVYGRLDLVFRNNTSGNIYMTAHVNEVKKNKYETEVCIYGPSLGDGVYYTLRTITVETTAAPLVATYQPDADQAYVIYKDEEPYLLRQAREGFVNETYLQRWENGQLVSETFISRDTCKAREAVYLTGTQDRPLDGF